MLLLLFLFCDSSAVEAGAQDATLCRAAGRCPQCWPPPPRVIRPLHSFTTDFFFRFIILFHLIVSFCISFWRTRATGSSRLSRYFPADAFYSLNNSNVPKPNFSILNLLCRSPQSSRRCASGATSTPAPVPPCRSHECLQIPTKIGAKTAEAQAAAGP
jgi:hypothetical protein